MVRCAPTTRSWYFIFVLGLVASHTDAIAAPLWQVDMDRSHLGFTATQAGAEVDGRFADFRADIYFDSRDLNSSRFAVEIDMLSVTTRNNERDDYLRSQDLFAVERWPTARFSAASFTKRANRAFVAEGALTLRGVTRPILLPFTFEESDDGAGATLTGGVTIRRLDYGVGQGDWQDTTWVGDQVRVTFRLYMSRKSPMRAQATQPSL